MRISFLERGLLLRLRQKSLITPLPVPDRAGAGLSGVNEMNFGRLHVGGAHDCSRDVCLLCERLSLRKKENAEGGKEKMCVGVDLCIGYA